MAIDGPLSGITVVDLTRVLAGPYCTMVLADLGARVVKVERPRGGDDAREIGPFIDGRSAYFASLNRDKESIALDLRDDADRAVFERLLERADVLVENFRPGTLERLGYGWDVLHRLHPRLIYAAVSGFGHTGPHSGRPAYDVIVQGMGGLMSLTGHPGGPPTRVGTSIGDITAGLFAAIGIHAALLHRASRGEGLRVDVAMLDCQVAILENAIARYCATGTVPGPLGSRHPSIAPFGAFATREGYLVIAAGNDALFDKLCRAIEMPALAADPRFADNERRTQQVEALQAELERALARHTAGEWLPILETAGVPCGPINDIAAVLRDPQIAARNMLVATGNGPGAKLRAAGNPIKLSAYPEPPTRAGAPDLDADGPRIREQLDD